MMIDGLPGGRRAHIRVHIRPFRGGDAGRLLGTGGPRSESSQAAQARSDHSAHRYRRGDRRLVPVSALAELEPRGRYLEWMMLNPSTADGTDDDATIRKCMKFARAWGYGGILVVNLLAWRETDSKLLKQRGYAELVGRHNNEFRDNPVSNEAMAGCWAGRCPIRIPRYPIDPPSVLLLE
jgi:hypothetical protein